MLIKLLLLHYAVMSLVSAAMHAVDKRRAIKERRRIPEKSLHSMELIGGWPGALMMTRLVKHKVSKPSYMWTLYAIVALHAVGWMALLWIGTR
jgi:uncharacterized membrane protein YsdA (DUF1294 family)